VAGMKLMNGCSTVATSGLLSAARVVRNNPYQFNIILLFPFQIPGEMKRYFYNKCFGPQHQIYSSPIEMLRMPSIRLR
jgi:hypothetical protein